MTLSDLGFIAFLYMHDFPVVFNDGKFTIDDENHKTTKAYFDYVNSIYIRYDHESMNLRSLKVLPNFKNTSSKRVKLVKVVHVSLAVYIKMRGYVVVGRPEHQTFIFEVCNGDTLDVDLIKLEFQDSSVPKFAAALKKVKKLKHSTPRVNT